MKSILMVGASVLALTLCVHGSSVANKNDVNQARPPELSQSHDPPAWYRVGQVVDGKLSPEASGQNHVTFSTGLTVLGDVEKELSSTAAKVANQVVASRFGEKAARVVVFSEHDATDYFLSRRHAQVLTLDDARSLGIEKQFLLAKGMSGTTNETDGEKSSGVDQGAYATGFGELELGPRFESMVEQRLRTARRDSRVVLVILGGLAVVATVLTAFAFFRLNHASRGMYPVRLQMVLFLALGGVLFLLAVIAGKFDRI